VSNRHCALLPRGDSVFVRDLGSANGTYLNGQKVTSDRPLHSDDWLRVGPVDLDVRIEASPPVSRPTPLPPTRGALPGAPDDENVAALLLSMGESRTASADTHSASNDRFPAGDTAVDMCRTKDTGSRCLAKGQPSSAGPKNTDTPAVAAELLRRYLRRSQMIRNQHLSG
jgi:predicted component of type VI protein secretion system